MYRERKEVENDAEEERKADAYLLVMVSSRVGKRLYLLLRHHLFFIALLMLQQPLLLR